uniref:Embryonic stem cell-specific 5-hydroxymethylcytosine-binding protein n=1 Tax=Fagus sylvatica TaxID=28930 RepID=A0A2N9H4Q1_FAGSY
MCGRGRCTLRVDDISRACHRNHASLRTLHMDRYRPSYNVSPGNHLPVVRREEGSNADADAVVLHCMKWGLIPTFTKKAEKPDHYKMFNARSESICEKASFRRLVPKNRCLVAVEGFYEWKKDGQKKQPYYIHFKDGRPLVFAALYDAWENSEGEILYTFTILTTSSSSALQWLHVYIIDWQLTLSLSLALPLLLVVSQNSSRSWVTPPPSSSINTPPVPTPFDNGATLNGVFATRSVSLVVFHSGSVASSLGVVVVCLRGLGSGGLQVFLWWPRSGFMEFFLDRMPVILGDKVSTDTWLNGSSSSKFDNMLKPYEDADLVWYPVTPGMGKPSFDGPECIKEIKLKIEGSNPITKFFSTKAIKKEESSNLEEKNSCAQSIKTDPPKSFKKELETEDNTAFSPFTEKGDQDARSNPISRFFSAEGIKEEQESNFEEKNSSAESFKTHPPKSFKKEPDTEDNKALLFFTGKGEQDSTSSVVHSQDGPAKCQLKRDYDELKGDSEQTTNETDKLCSTPARKKGNLKGGGDKQPTLFSYFGKS